MMIAYPPAGIVSELDESHVLSVVVENQTLFRSIICDIHEQINGSSGAFVLSENFTPLDIRKNVDLITSFIPFEINQKEIINKLYIVLKNKAVDGENFQRTQELYSYISKYLFALSAASDDDLIFDYPDDINGILKAFNVRLNDREMTLPEKIMEYMLISEKLKRTKLFVTVNMRSFISDKKIEQLFKSIVLHKINLICIENKEYPRLDTEKVIIIDEDMCVI